MKNQPAYQRLFDKVRLRNDYFAFFLFEYQRIEQLSNEEMNAFLSCNDEDFYRLAFCRVPEKNDENFAEKISQIAEYANISKTKLFKIFNRVHAIHALRQSSQTIMEETFLMAAREKNKTRKNKRSNQ